MVIQSLFTFINPLQFSIVPIGSTLEASRPAEDKDPTASGKLSTEYWRGIRCSPWGWSVNVSEPRKSPELRKKHVGDPGDH